MPGDRQNSLTREVEAAREAMEVARHAALSLEAEIKKKENEIETTNSITERDISNLEREESETSDFQEAEAIHDLISRRRSDQVNRLNELESQIGELKRREIEIEVDQKAAEARLGELLERANQETQRSSISAEQVARAAELEKRLESLERERADLVHQIEEYAPLVEAQREAATGSGSVELSRAYTDQADDYRQEWQRWLRRLVMAILAALVAGVLAILLAHPSEDASNSTIASRIAIQILVLGLLVYLVRVAAHQFRVHRHLETVCRNKASALLTFNRLVAGPGEAEVRTAVAVTLAQAVFDSNSTGFIDHSQDGVTIVERVVGPVAQRLSS